MPSYRTLPSGKTQAVVKYHGKRWYRTGPRRAVERWAKNLERDLIAGLDPDRPVDGGPTVEEWSERWMAARVAEPTTLAGDKSRMATHVVKRWGQVPLDEVSPLDVQGWVRQMSRTLAADTVRKVHSLLAQMMADAVKERLIAHSPCEHTDLPTVPPGREVWLTEEQVAAIAEAARVGPVARHALPTPAPGHPACSYRGHLGPGLPQRLDRSAEQGYALIWTLYLTGARWGEATGLRVQDLDFLRRRIRIAQVNTRSGLKAYPKGRRNRTVPMPGQLADILAAHLDPTTQTQRQRSAERSAATPLRTRQTPAPNRPQPNRSALVFQNARGGPLSDANFRHRIWTDAVKNAGLGELKPRIHDLRHSCASRLVQAGVPMSEIAAHLGHSSIRTSERYSHLGEHRHDAVLVALERGTIAQ